MLKSLATYGRSTGSEAVVSTKDLFDLARSVHHLDIAAFWTAVT